jgi:hypothetical protein
MIMGTGASRFWWPQGLLSCLQELVDDAAAVLDELCVFEALHDMASPVAASAREARS